MATLNDVLKDVLEKDFDKEDVEKVVNPRDEEPAGTDREAQEDDTENEDVGQTYNGPGDYAQNRVNRSFFHFAAFRTRALPYALSIAGRRYRYHPRPKGMLGRNFGTMIAYSGNMWGNPHPDDLSRCSSYKEFIEKLNFVLKKLYICCSSYGRPRSATYASSQYKALLRNNGLPDIRFHDLRHTYASMLLSEELSVKAVSNTLGHAKSIVTVDVYGDKARIIGDGTDAMRPTLEYVLPTEYITSREVGVLKKRVVYDSSIGFPEELADDIMECLLHKCA